MAIVDRLIVEIVGDSLDLQNSLSEADDSLRDFESRSSGRMLSLWESIKLGGTVITGVVGTLKVMDESVNRIVENESRFRRMFNFSDDDIERAERYKGLLSEMLGLTSGIGMDVVARVTNAALETSESGMGRTGELDPLRKWMGNAIGNWLVPPNVGPATEGETNRWVDMNIPREERWGYDRREKEMFRQMDFEEKLPGMMSGMIGGMASVIAESIGAGVGSMGEMAGGGLDSARRWMLANQRRGKDMVETIGSTGITLGDTAEGYREMHEQRTQTQVLVDQNKEQTNLLKDIRDNLKREDPFA